MAQPVPARVTVKLPNAENALVERSKVTDYLLAFDHPEGAGKAEFFTRLGFTAAEWEIWRRH